MIKPSIFDKANNMIGKFALNKLQRDYLKKYSSDLPVVTISGLVEKNVEILLIKRLFEANDWVVYEESDVHLFKSIKQKNTILLTTQDSSVESLQEDLVSRGPNFSLIVNSKYTLNNQYLWPKSIAYMISNLENLASKYNLTKVVLQDILGKIELPPHTFDKVKGRMDTTIIDSTFSTDSLSIHSFLDIFEEVVTIYSHADFDSPEYNNSIVVPPKHTIILGQMPNLAENSVREHTKVLNRLNGYRKDYEYYLDEMYLVGDEWLKCDDQGFAKLDGLVSYIRYGGHTFKVVKNPTDLDTFLIDDLIRPHSWFWLKGSCELDWLHFRLTK